MPTYNFLCSKCHAQYETVLKISELDEFKKGAACIECSAKLQQIIVTPPSVAIAHQHQAAPHASGDKQARVPINIIDHQPDGGVKVTRIGKKSDIENE